MAKRHITTALTITLLCALHSMAQAELYKVIDDDGNVSFSQFPPADTSADVESIELKGLEGGMTPVSLVGAREVCGEIELPSKYDYSNSEDALLRRIAQRSKSWHRQLERLEESVQRDSQRRNERYSNPYYRNSNRRTQQDLEYFKRREKQISQIKDLRCALNWSERQQQSTNARAQAQREELERLERVHATLLATQEKACGSEPRLDPSDTGARARRDAWIECSRSYQRDLRDVSREMRNVSRQTK